MWRLQQNCDYATFRGKYKRLRGAVAAGRLHGEELPGEQSSCCHSPYWYAKISDGFKRVYTTETPDLLCI
jgi:hypothetical protein